MGTIEFISFVWNHTHDVSMDACYADEHVPIVLSDVPVMLNVYGNKDEWVTLTAGGNDDGGSSLGNDDDVVRAIRSNYGVVSYITRDKRLTPVCLLQMLSLFIDDPNAMNTTNIITRAKPCGNDVYILGWR